MRIRPVYGMTETTGPATLALPDANAGAVVTLLPPIRIKRSTSYSSRWMDSINRVRLS